MWKVCLEHVWSVASVLDHNPKSWGKKWKIEILANIMKACIIMHNMIVDDEQHCDLKLSYNRECTQPVLQGPSYQELVQGTIEIKDVKTFYNFHGNLIEHLHKHHGRMHDHNEYYDQ